MLLCIERMNPAEFHNIAKTERDFWWYRGMRRIMFGMLDPVVAKGSSQHVLEAGCGTGHFARELEQRYGWSVTALDLGFEGLEYARGYQLKRLVQGDITALPFADASFDGLVSMDVVVHLRRGPGTLTVKASVKSFQGPERVSYAMPALPQATCASCLLNAAAMASPFAVTT